MLFECMRTTKWMTIVTMEPLSTCQTKEAYNNCLIIDYVLDLPFATCHQMKMEKTSTDSGISFTFKYLTSIANTLFLLLDAMSLDWELDSFNEESSGQLQEF